VKNADVAAPVFVALLLQQQFATTLRRYPKPVSRFKFGLG